MRSNPIGTGPFKFVEYKPNQWLKLDRNPDYWKPGLPYLDGIEYTIIPNRSTAVLGVRRRQVRHDLSVGDHDPAVEGHQEPGAAGHLRGRAAQRLGHLAMVRKPPFDNIEIRRALALALDRQAFIDILGDGQGDISAVMLPPPEGIWGIPIEQLRPLPGYAADVAASREEARAIMRRHGYGPDTPLA